MAFKNLKKHTTRFLKYESGKRFVHYYDLVNRHIKDNLSIKIFLIAIGVVLFCVGFILLFIPGPGMLFIAISGVLFCLSSRKLALFFDRTEMKIRDWCLKRKKTR